MIIIDVFGGLEKQGGYPSNSATFSSGQNKTEIWFLLSSPFFAFLVVVLFRISL